MRSKKEYKVAVVLGTRPEIIKLTPVIKALEEKGLFYTVIHTGQHYSHELDRIFFDELELMAADHALDIGSGTHGLQTGMMLQKIEEVLIEEKCDYALVQGDTNTTLAGALAAVKLQIPVGHIEAGIRSYDRTMPEEINRVLVDHMADDLYAPTEIAVKQLLQEGIENECVYLTGNTVVDVLESNTFKAMKKSRVLKKLILKPKNYLLFTLHRAENVDCISRLNNIVAGIRKIIEHEKWRIIWPMHPRCKKQLKQHGLLGEINRMKKMKIIEPVGYFDFQTLQRHARLVLTDSGGVQEECCILGVPCITLRDNTERPETLVLGANALVGANQQLLIKAVVKMLQTKPRWQHPYGDGDAGRRIVEAVCDRLDCGYRKESRNGSRIVANSLLTV